MPKIRKLVYPFLIAALVITVPALFAKAEEDADEASDITATDVGYSENVVNNATQESATEIETSGTLVEIGNTTAEETTIIVRVPDGEGGTTDETLQVDTQSTDFVNEDGESSDLSDWIAGDTLQFSAEKNLNSGELVAKKVRNRAMKKIHRGKNGWVTALRPEENEMDVTWANQTFTFNLSSARMVAGAKNPAAIADFQVGDRIRARLQDDGDKNPQTWNAKIVVVLRRGDALFMRVTRWVVPAKIVSMPDEPVATSTITVKILPNKFHQEGDVNNLIGNPGDTLVVSISETTDLRRRFLGKCFLSEFSEGDNLRIVGRLNEQTGNLDAKTIKNNSIQKMGVQRRIGMVTEIDENSLKANLIKNSNPYTVTLSKDAKIHKRGVGEIPFSKVKEGDKIRVRGTFNRLQKNVAANVISILNEN
ncbi:MAG: hypothetical protein V1770_06315 [bacterium]